MDFTSLIPAGVMPYVLIILAILVVLALAVSVFLKIKNKNIAGALQDGQKMLEAVTRAVDTIKNVTEEKDRSAVRSVLKATGKTLEEAGLKEKLDVFLRDHGLSETS